MSKISENAKKIRMMDTLQTVCMIGLPREGVKSGKKSVKCAKILVKRLDIAREK